MRMNWKYITKMYENGAFACKFVVYSEVIK